MKFWNFIKNQEGDVELRLDGEIVSDDDIWIYEWFGIPAASPNAFREALAEHKGKAITVWIDSWGGDVFAAAGMYNALKEHKGKVTVKVDGKAVSAASIVAMAGDELLMTPVSIMMLHNPLTGVRGEAKELRRVADVLDEVKEAIMNAYEMKSGRSREEISTLMDRESWMSAKTAIAEGFSDGMLYAEVGEPIENSYMVSGLAIQNSVNDVMKKFFEVWQKHQSTQPPEENPANGRVFDIKRRVNVREKQNRRKNAWTNSKG